MGNEPFKINTSSVGPSETTQQETKVENLIHEKAVKQQKEQEEKQKKKQEKKKK